EYNTRPISGAVAVPLFAFMAAGVAMNGEAIASAAADPIAQGVSLGLVLGKPIGIVLATWLVAKLTSARLSKGMGRADVFSLSLVAAAGASVSREMVELAFGADHVSDDHGYASVFLGSPSAAMLGAALLTFRSRHHAKHSVALN